MKAIILSAGYGTRLGDITKNKPKPLIDIGGKPVISHILDHLNAYSICDVIVNIHYLPELIPDFVKERALFFYEPRLLGHKRTIFALKHWLKNDDFFVINGDTITNINYDWMYKNHKPNSISAYMDEWRCAGTWIYSKEYFNENLPIYPYYEQDSFWFDIGSPIRLDIAKKYFGENYINEKEFNYL